MPTLILIADHDPVQRRLLEAMLRRFGFQSESVDSGQAALARLAATGEPPVSLLILDLFLGMWLNNVHDFFRPEGPRRLL